MGSVGRALPGVGVRSAHQAVRAEVPHLEEDRVPAEDIATVYRLLVGETIVNQVETAVGPLQALS